MEWLLVALNALAFVIFCALASYANWCLMRRDDKNIEKRNVMYRMERSRESQQRRRIAGARNIGVPSPLGHNSPSATSLHSLSPASPTSPTNSRSSRAISDDEEDRHSESEDAENCLAPLTAVHSTVGSDVRCWFFVLVFTSSLTEGIVGLVLLLQSHQSELDLDGKRRAQDLIVAPAIMTVYITFTSLLLILFYLVEKEVGGGNNNVKHAAVGVLVAVLLPLVVCFNLVLFDVWAQALEAYSTAAEFTLAIAFGAAAFYLPKRVMSFGQEMKTVSRKIRDICVVVSICMIVRGILILSPVQNALGALGEYALPFLESATAFPLMLSLMLLSGRA